MAVATFDGDFSFSQDREVDFQPQFSFVVMFSFLGGVGVWMEELLLYWSTMDYTYGMDT